MCWYKLCISILHCINRRFCQVFHSNKPLLWYSWFYSCMTTIAGTYIVLMVFYFQKSTFCLQVSNDRFSCLIAVHACIFRIIFYNLGIICQYIDHFQIMTKSYLKVVRVMCRCDLYNTCTKFHINIIICDNWDLTMYNWKIQSLTHHIFVTIIIRINCYCRITK